MSPTALKRVAIALGILVILWGMFALLRRSGEGSAEGPGITVPDSSAVDRIVIRGGDDSVAIVRGADGTWTVNGHAADSARVGEWFSAVREAAASGDLVARSASSHTRLGVDEVTGRRVVFIAGGDTVFDAIAGNSGRAMGSGYLRLPGADEVYQVRGQFTTLGRRGVNDWRDRAIASVPVDSIDRIEVERRGEGYTLLRNTEGGWIVGDQPADSATVARLVGALRNLQASGFPTESQLDSISFEQPYRRLRVADASDRTLLAMVFDTTTFGTWARLESGGPVYRLDWWRIDGLTPADSTIYAQ